MNDWIKPGFKLLILSTQSFRAVMRAFMFGFTVTVADRSQHHEALAKGCQAT